MTDLAERIERLEARQAIADLVHTYARYVRADEPEKIASLFLPDATFEVAQGHPDRPERTVSLLHRSQKELHDMMSSMKGKPHPVPLIRNLVIEVDGDTASVNCVMDGAIYTPEGTKGAFMGEYRDTCRRIDGRWYFASRSFTMFKGASAM